MDVTLPLDEMTIAEKLRVMEALWQDLSKHEDEVESPAWHLEVLQERELREEAGLETYSDWEEAKARLRQLHE